MSSKESLEMAPVLQTMHEYIDHHFFDELMDEVESAVKLKLFDGLELESDHGDAVVNRHECRFISTTLWRLNRTTLLADIKARLKIGMDNGEDIPQYRVHHVYFTARFELYKGIRLIRGIQDMSAICSPERELPKLSKHLVPVLSYDEMEVMVMDMLRLYVGEHAVREFQPDGANQLAAAMGLSIMHISLYGNRHTSAILYLKDGIARSVTSRGIDAGTEREDYKEVCVPAKTIVVNDNVVHQGDTEKSIYHECCHYEWHSMFYELQELHTADLRLLNYKEADKASRPAEKDIRWIERQAAFAGLAAMFPRTVFVPLVHTYWKEIVNAQKNLGEKYAHVIYMISRDKQKFKSIIKSRLISLGAYGAKGAYNYVDGKYIKDFAYNRNNVEPNDTFVISRADFTDMYERDKKFRELINTKQFIYVDGHICCNLPVFVRKADKEVSLTEWALGHIDECCLKFKRCYCYYYDYCKGYRIGELQSDEEYNESYLMIHSLDISHLTREKIEEKNIEYLDELPRSPSKALSKLVKDRLGTQSGLAAASGLSKSTVSRMCTDDYFNYSIQDVTRLVIGLQLPPPLSSMLLELTRFPRSVMARYYRYQCIIDCLFMEDIETIVETHPQLFA